MSRGAGWRTAAVQHDGVRTHGCPCSRQACSKLRRTWAGAGTRGGKGPGEWAAPSWLRASRSTWLAARAVAGWEAVMEEEGWVAVGWRRVGERAGRRRRLGEGGGGWPGGLWEALGGSGSWTQLKGSCRGRRAGSDHFARAERSGQDAAQGPGCREACDRTLAWRNGSMARFGARREPLLLCPLEPTWRATPC